MEELPLSLRQVFTFYRADSQGGKRIFTGTRGGSPVDVILNSMGQWNAESIEKELEQI